MLSYPGVVTSGVVGNPVEYDLHSEFVSLLDGSLELFECAKLGIERSVVFHGVVTSELTFLAIL